MSESVIHLDTTIQQYLPQSIQKWLFFFQVMLRAQEKLYQQERKLRMGEKDYSFGILRFILQNPQLPLWILSFAWAFFFMADFQSKKCMVDMREILI